MRRDANDHSGATGRCWQLSLAAGLCFLLAAGCVMVWILNWSRPGLDWDETRYQWVMRTGSEPTPAYWLPAVPLGLAGAALSYLASRSLVRARSSAPGIPRCAKCGYDLRATPDRCPECGTANV